MLGSKLNKDGKDTEFITSIKITKESCDDSTIELIAKKYCHDHISTVTVNFPATHASGKKSPSENLLYNLQLLMSKATGITISGSCMNQSMYDLLKKIFTRNSSLSKLKFMPYDVFDICDFATPTKSRIAMEGIDGFSNDQIITHLKNYEKICELVENFIESNSRPNDISFIFMKPDKNDLSEAIFQERTKVFNKSTPAGTSHNRAM